MAKEEERESNRIAPCVAELLMRQRRYYAKVFSALGIGGGRGSMLGN